MEGLTFSFGLLIAYVIPGLVTLYSIAPFSVTVNGLLRGVALGSTGVVLILLASLGTGMIVNAVTAASIRKLFRLLGTKTPSDEEFANLTPDQIPLHERIVDTTYRYFECYTNMTAAIAIACISKMLLNYRNAISPYEGGIKAATLAVILYCTLRAGHRTFRQYCVRMRKILEPEKKLVTK